MQIENIEISGYRGFKKFKVTSSKLSGLTVIAGQNGTGKSTILEVVNFVLNAGDLGQIDQTISNGITGTETEWKVVVSFSEDEIDEFCKYLNRGNPQVFQSTERLKIDIEEALERIGNKYFLQIRVTIFPPSGISAQPEKKVDFGKNHAESYPQWFSELGKQKLLATYVKPLQDINIGGTQFMGGLSALENDFSPLATTEFDIRKRLSRTNINLGELLNKLAFADLWKAFSKIRKDFPLLQETLSRINDVIFPLELLFDKEEIEEGQISFQLRNNKINRTYPIQFASAGEIQVIGLAAFLIEWGRQRFKRVVLIDEPDIHLHPEYIKRLAEFMDYTFSAAKDFTCIIATHSTDFIAANTENVFQISTDSKSINKVINLRERVQLLYSLGRSLDLDFLIEKVVYVEGVQISKNHLEDYKIYEKIIDPTKNKIAFVPSGILPGSGSKTGTIKGSEQFAYVIEKISGQASKLKVYPLVDKDKGYKKKANVLVTPFTNVENLFLCDMEAVCKVTKLSKTDIENILVSIDKDAITKPLDVDGKKVFQKFYAAVCKKISDLKKLTYKGFQLRILKEFNVANSPDAVKAFVNIIKKL